MCGVREHSPAAGVCVAETQPLLWATLRSTPLQGRGAGVTVHTQTCQSPVQVMAVSPNLLSSYCNLEVYHFPDMITDT